jgi:hypothetical protein
MARLDGVKAFDTHFHRCAESLRRLVVKRQTTQGTWSREQQEQFDLLWNAFAALTSAVSEIVHNNR